MLYWMYFSGESVVNQCGSIDVGQLFKVQCPVDRESYTSDLMNLGSDRVVQ